MKYIFSSKQPPISHILVRVTLGEAALPGVCGASPGTLSSIMTPELTGK